MFRTYFHQLAFYLVLNSSDVFTNLFPRFCLWIFLSLSSRRQTSYWSKAGYFSQLASWKRNHKEYSLKKIVDLEFEIGETIWWTQHKIQYVLTRCRSGWINFSPSPWAGLILSFKLSPEFRSPRLTTEKRFTAGSLANSSEVRINWIKKK